MRFVETERSVGELFKDLKDDSVYLVRQEVALAKTELKESAERVMRDAAIMGAGALIALLGAMALVGALCLAAFVLFDLFLDAAIAIWLGPLLVGAVLTAAGLITLQAGRKKLAREDLSPDLTRQTMKENKQWVREKMT